MNDTRSRGPMAELVLARTREFLREPEAVFWVFAFPIVLALALGFAFRDKPPDRIPVGLVEGPGSGTLRAALERSPALLLRVYPEAASREALGTGAVSLLVEPGAPPVYRFDPTRPDARAARLEVDDAIQRAAGRADPVPVRDETVREKGARYIDWLVPGLLGMNIMGTGVWGVAFTIVTARGKKLLKRYLATPMRKSHYLGAQVLSRLGFLFGEVGVVLVFARAVFGVSVRGSFALLVLVCVTGSLAFTALGLLAASRVTTIEGVSGLVNLMLVPMWILSGVFFSYTRFPDTALPFIRALPLTALNDALRAVMLEGRALPDLAAPLAVLVAWGVVSFGAALRIFRWK